MEHEARSLLEELLATPVHFYQDVRDSFQCLFCDYEHREFSLEMEQEQRLHYPDCLIVRARMLLARGSPEHQP